MPRVTLGETFLITLSLVVGLALLVIAQLFEHPGSSHRRVCQAVPRPGAGGLLSP